MGSLHSLTCRGPGQPGRGLFAGRVVMCPCRASTITCDNIKQTALQQVVLGLTGE